ncbi:hypothetical protein E4T56_gene1493 [Termitomyces sp. T112]|nr:hypothetical protein E4T56_gene1493 [Termitomyces sp. T112]
MQIHPEVNMSFILPPALNHPYPSFPGTTTSLPPGDHNDTLACWLLFVGVWNVVQAGGGPRAGRRDERPAALAGNIVTVFILCERLTHLTFGEGRGRLHLRRLLLRRPSQRLECLRPFSGYDLAVAGLIIDIDSIGTRRMIIERIHVAYQPNNQPRCMSSDHTIDHKKKQDKNNHQDKYKKNSRQK